MSYSVVTSDGRREAGDMSDLLHNHLTIGLENGLDVDCPACEQLEADFCGIAANSPVGV